MLCRTVVGHIMASLCCYLFALSHKLYGISMMYLYLNTFLSINLSQSSSIYYNLYLSISLSISLSMCRSAEGESGAAIRTDRPVDHHLRRQKNGQDGVRGGLAQQGSVVRVRVLAVLAEYC